MKLVVALPGDGSEAAKRMGGHRRRVLAETVARCDAGELPGCPVIETLSAG